MPYQKIRIRDDDILVRSSQWKGKEFERFRGFHNIICGDTRYFQHVLAILVTEIQEFPECIEFIKQETAEGRMFPEVHGLHHIDYAGLSGSEVTEQLSAAKKWIEDTFIYTPVQWYSPWGAGSDVRGAHLREAAASAGLTLVTCDGMIKPGELVEDVRRTKAGKITKEKLLANWEGKEILRHWWEGAGALRESVQFFKETF